MCTCRLKMRWGSGHYNQEQMADSVLAMAVSLIAINFSLDQVNSGLEQLTTAVARSVRIIHHDHQAVVHSCS